MRLTGGSSTKEGKVVSLMPDPEVTMDRPHGNRATYPAVAGFSRLELTGMEEAGSVLLAFFRA